jgi:hypothetical protein
METNCCKQTIDHTHLVSDDYGIPKDSGEKAVFQKIQFLHTVLEECLNTDHMNSLGHPYEENYDANNVYLELKKHTLAFTMEQLSHDTLINYKLTIQHPGKWHGTLFEVVLHWHEQIKQYTWLKLIGLLPAQTLCLMQKPVDDVISTSRNVITWKISIETRIQ